MSDTAMPGMTTGNDRTQGTTANSAESSHGDMSAGTVPAPNSAGGTTDSANSANPANGASEGENAAAPNDDTLGAITTGGTGGTGGDAGTSGTSGTSGPHEGAFEGEGRRAGDPDTLRDGS